MVISTESSKEEFKVVQLFSSAMQLIREKYYAKIVHGDDSID